MYTYEQKKKSSDLNDTNILKSECQNAETYKVHFP
jgi:hypothetical protein